MTDTPRRRRRLSAIFMADVAGFSAMMGRDEERTVELVLESGVLSAEHVLNVVARLRSAPPIASVETCLPLNEAPAANTERYDLLRTPAADEEISHA